MDEDREPPAWYSFYHPGRRLANWRGTAAFGALVIVSVVGGWAESALRPGHPVLAFVVLVPLALVAIGLAALIVMRTK